MISLLPNSRRPDVSFYQDGRIDITARIAKMLHLQAGDVIDIAAEGGEFYLYVRLQASECTGRHEAQVFATKRGNNFRAHSVKLCRTMFSIVGTSPARLPAGSPVIFGMHGVGIPLITLNPIKNEPEYKIQGAVAHAR